MLSKITRHPIRCIAVAAALVAVCLAGGSPLRAFAYGPTHLYELTISYNCQNQTLCASSPFGIGGLWGWIEPDAGGSADGHLTFQGHQNADPAANGVGHSTAMLGWSIINCASASPPFDCLFVALEATPTDPNGLYFDVPTVFSTAGGPAVLPVLVPATPGHYSDHVAPGVFSNANVTQL
jgi:hypothetical protein